MNYLAHQFLSGTNKEIRVGNFLGDFMKGKDLEDFSGNILLGIELHRIIDEFTDTHEAVHRSKKILHSKQGKYASVLLDIYYDYFLAKNWSKYSEQPLKEFATSVYDDIHRGAAHGHSFHVHGRRHAETLAQNFLHRQSFDYNQLARIYSRFHPRRFYFLLRGKDH